MNRFQGIQSSRKVLLDCLVTDNVIHSMHYASRKNLKISMTFEFPK